VCSDERGCRGLVWLLVNPIVLMFEDAQAVVITAEGDVRTFDIKVGYKLP